MNEDDLTCSVCYELPPGEVHQCTRGHFRCSSHCTLVNLDRYAAPPTASARKKKTRRSAGAGVDQGIGAFGGPVAFVVRRAHAAELRRELTDEWKRRVANDDVLLARLASRRSSSHFVARESQLCWEHEPEKEEWARKRRERQREQARKRALGYP